MFQKDWKKNFRLVRKENNKNGCAELENNIYKTQLGKRKEKFFQDAIVELKAVHEPIVVAIDNQTHHYLYYDDSLLLRKLAYYPYVQVGLVSAFFCLLLFFK